ncbi:effector-associated constant component EACC1 [Streptomyces sp. RGM 3693]|uniref:effector-associated constant component EACC1 n=1 Tax=Streptomyces sp. RGM 3693 TaxID=3413284 RepID=UPI003D2A7F9A
MTDLEVRAVPEPGGDAEEELRSLMRWLHDDEELHRQVRGSLTASRGPRPGEMGLGFDLLQLALGTAVSGGSLAVSVLQWRDARRRAPELTLRAGEIEVRIPRGAAADPETVRRIVALLDEAQEPGGDDRTA